MSRNVGVFYEESLSMKFIQDDKKSLCTWWLQYRKLQVMFKVSPASLQTLTLDLH
jgi:hypothetical protein